MNKHNKYIINKNVKEILDLNEISFSISDIILQYRKANNLTQKDLAKKLKITQSTMSKIESGNFNFTFKQIYEMSKKLTNSSDMFKDILKDILKQLDAVDIVSENLNKDEASNLEVTIPWNDSCKLEKLRKSISPNALLNYLIHDYNKLYEEFKVVDHECTRLEEKELKLIDENNHLNDLLSALETYYDITQEDLENSIKLDK